MIACRCAAPATDPLLDQSEADWDRTVDVKGVFGCLKGGANRTRTGDPLLAKQVLYQLSYRPSADLTKGTVCASSSRAREICSSPEHCRSSALAEPVHGIHLHGVAQVLDELVVTAADIAAEALVVDVHVG